MNRFISPLLLTLLCSASLRSQTHLYTFEGSRPSGWFGQAISGVGDLDKDGHADFIVGLWWERRTHPSGGNIARVLSGRDGRVLYAFKGGSTSGGRGTAVSFAGDVDRDGAGDFIVSEAGTIITVLVYSGKTRKIIYRFPHGRTEVSVAGAGDVNKDGHDDILVGDPQGGGIFMTGRAIVYSGKDGSVLHDLKPGSFVNPNYVNFGMAVAGVGDLNKDGYDDFAVADPQHGMRFPTPGSGRVWVYSGKDAKVLYTWFRLSEPANSFGAEMAGVGDTNRDGYPDILVGARGSKINHRYLGSARLFSGKDGSVLRDLVGRRSYDAFGSAVAAAGDVDKDGYADFIVGASWDDTFKTNAGSVQVFSGKDGRVLLHAFGRKAEDHLGESVAGPGDVNGDGAPDLMAGTQPPRTAVPYFRVFSGAPMPLWSDTHSLSLSKGGSQTLTLEAGPSHANGIYLLLGSMSGIRPGIRLGQHTLPLNPDLYLLLTLGFPNSSFLPASLGLLDSSGKASSRFTVIPQIPSSLIGRVLDHAYVVISPFQFKLASNSVPLTLAK